MAISLWWRFSVPFLVVAIGVSLLALSSGHSKAQWVPNTPQFQPAWDVKTCNDLRPTFSGPPELRGGGGTCTPDTSPGAHPDTTVPFVVPTGHHNYDTGFIVVASGNAGSRLDGSQVGGPNPDGTGAPAGGLESTSTLGLTANPCNSTTPSAYIWWEAEYDVTDKVACAPEGTEDRFSNLVYDDDPDPDGVSRFGQADNDSPLVTQIPDCVLELFDPDGDGIDTDGNPATIGDQPVQVNYRMAGATNVAGSFQMLQNFEFAPGDLQAAYLANPNATHHNFAKLDPSIGYVSLTVLNAPGATILEPNPISDFCSLLASKGMTKGQIDTDGDTVAETDRATGPVTPGSYQYQMRTMGLRDADGDGIDNWFDTCAWLPNTAAESPWNQSGPDTDMLDSVCDPFPLVKDDDEDGDAYLNNQDYCPLVANPVVGDPPTSGEADSETDDTLTTYNAANPDHGPGADGIGDTCDSEGGGHDLINNGLFFASYHVDSVVVTGGGVVDSDGDGWGSDMDPEREVIDGRLDMDGDTDVDGDDDGIFGATDVYDGFLDMDDDTDVDGDDDGIFGATDVYDGGLDMDDDTDVDGDDDGTYDGDSNADVPGQMTTAPMDSAGIKYSPSLDSDGDDYTNLDEWYMGADPGNDCPAFTSHDAWPSDMDNSGTANLLDLLVFKPAFNCAAGSGCYNVRVDLDVNDTVNLLDLLPFKPHFNATCTFP